MGTITLIGEAQARPGSRFRFVGPNDGPNAECRPCKLQGTCFNLEPGEVYAVGEVRAKTHPCFLHDGSAVRVVVVERAAHDVIVPGRGLIEGETLVYPERECEFRGCPMWSECVGAPLIPRKDYLVEKVGERVDCPLGYDLRRARLVRR